MEMPIGVVLIPIGTVRAPIRPIETYMHLLVPHTIGTYTAGAL